MKHPYSLKNIQHRRYNPLLDEWVLVSPHRTKRPWQGEQQAVKVEATPEYVKDCYLCPGNTRANGEVNPHYSGTRAFINDFSALRSDIADTSWHFGNNIRAESEYGICKVLCYHPHHNKHIGSMSLQQICEIICMWREQYAELSTDKRLSHIQMFENRGSAMGASNPHPHGQLWANQTIPHLAQKKAHSQVSYHQQHSARLLLDYLHDELSLSQRIVYQNASFVWLVPYWAVWPFETMILPTAPFATLQECDNTTIEQLASILKVAVQSYDKVFNIPFPYSMGIHLPPIHPTYHSSWQFHIGFYPPLLRSAAIRKFMVGYELCAMPQRDITPEYASDVLQQHAVSLQKS